MRVPLNSALTDAVSTSQGLGGAAAGLPNPPWEYQGDPPDAVRRPKGYPLSLEALSKPGFVGNNSLSCLNGKPHRASVLHVRLDDHFPPSSTPAFSRARRRTGSTLRPGPAVLRSDFAHRFGPLYPALRMVRQRCSTVSAHLVGACVHRQARLSVSYHQRAH